MSRFNILKWPPGQLIVIVIIASYFRITHLANLPHDLHSDEVMNGYVGRFTLQNGVDLYGHRLPWLYFDNFGDYPNILPMYLSGLFTYIWGLNAWAVRLPIALAGVLTVAMIYKVARELFPKTTVPFWSALLLAISPWHIVLSRATAEAVTAAAVYLGGLWCFFRGWQSRGLRWFGLSAGCLGLTYFLYPSFRVLVPLGLLPAIFLVRGVKLKILVAAMAVGFLITTAAISLTIWGQGRYQQTSVFTFNDVLKIRLTQLIYQDSGVPLTLTRIFHNKYGVAAREIANQYAAYWSGNFLLVRGGLPARYQLTDQGLGYLSLAGLGIVWGFLALTGHLKPQTAAPRNLSAMRTYYAVLVLLAPVPAALTLEDAPNVHRALLFGVLLTLWGGWIIHAVGTSTWKWRRWLLAAVAVGVTCELGYFWHQYAIHGRVSQAPARNSEVAPLVAYLLAHQNRYPAVFVPTEAHVPIHYLFTAGILDNNLAGHFSRDLYISTVKHIRFDPDSCPSRSDLPKTAGSLIVDRATCPRSDSLKYVTTLKRADGFDGYFVYEN